MQGYYFNWFFFDFTMYIYTVIFFFNLDKFYVKRSEPGSLGLSAL